MISLLFMTENRQFHSFIIVTMILISTHDSAIRWDEVSGAGWIATSARKCVRNPWTVCIDWRIAAEKRDSESDHVGVVLGAVDDNPGPQK